MIIVTPPHVTLIAPPATSTFRRFIRQRFYATFVLHRHSDSPPFVAAICPIDLQLCIHNVGSFNVRICLFSGIVRNCYTESISLTKIVLRFVTTVLFIITKYIRCFASLSILRKTEYQSKNRNMKDFCPTTTRTCKMIDSEATFINSID